MMYTAAALAMILPLMDLHCGKSTCKVDDLVKKADVNGLATAVELKKVTSKVSNFATSGELNPLAKEATLKTAAGEVKKIHQRLPDFANKASANTYDASKDALVVKKDLDVAINGLNIPTSIATPANVTNAQTDIKRHVTAEIGTAVKVGTSGGIAGHDQLATVDDIVDELKLDLITGTGTSTKDKIAAITTAVNALKTDVKSVKTDGAKETSVQSVNTKVNSIVAQLPASSKKIASSDEVAAVQTKIDNALVAQLPASSKKIASSDEVAAVQTKIDNALPTKKYARIQLTVLGSGANYVLTQTASTCDAETTKEGTAPEYILCCALNGANTVAYLAQYTGSGSGSSFVAANYMCGLAKPKVSSHSNIGLCNVDQVSNLKSVAGAIDAQLQSNAPNFLPNQKTLSAVTDTTAMVWTGIRCD